MVIKPIIQIYGVVMNILDKINDDLKNALKTKDEIKLSTLRILKSQIKNQEIQNKKNISEDEIIKIISKQIKQRNDSITEYKKAKRQDLIDRENQEIHILKPYLPEQKSDEEIEEIISQTIKETQASSISDIGKVMPQVIKKTKGRADNSKIAQMVKQKLQS